MFDAFYSYLRSAIGFSLVVAGLSFRLSHGSERSLRAFGNMYIAVGLLLSMSALGSVVRLPVDLDNLLYQGLMLSVGLSLIDIALYLFGNEHKKGSRFALVRAGIAYESLLVLSPLLDYAFVLGPVKGNVEDSLIRAPLHGIAVSAAYAWPIAATVASLLMARWKLADITDEYPEMRRLLAALRVLGIVIAAILASLVLSLRVPYRIGHIGLEVLLLLGYFYVVKNPRALMRLRSEIEKEHAKRLSLGEEEAALIEKRLATITVNREVILDENLDLKTLSALVGIPPYRLSTYFGSRIGSSFPAWRNRLRIDYIRARMAERPDLTILEISLEAGYRSKTSFNEQFSRIVGMSPSEYRRRLGEEETRSDS